MNGSYAIIVGVSFDQAPQVPDIHFDKFNLIGGECRGYEMDRAENNISCMTNRERHIVVYSIRLPRCDWLKNIHHNVEGFFLIEDNREKNLSCCYRVSEYATYAPEWHNLKKLCVLLFLQ